MSSITKIGTAVPKYKNKQSDIQRFMIGISTGNDTDKRKTSLMYARSGIASRYSVVPDYSCQINERVFFPKTADLEPFPNLEKRMELFQKNACNLAIKAVKDTFQNENLPNSITHLITVSCTGLSAPGLDVELVKVLNLPTDIHRTSVNFMGCYAAIHALKQAEAICKAQAEAKVLIVLVELCTLHFQKEETLDFITSNLLFGDGAACCLVENEPNGLNIESFYSKLFLENQESMGWHLSSNGFLMSLKTEVPKLIEENIEDFVLKSLERAEISKNEIDNWAIHPGGKKILDVTAKALQVKSGQMDESYQILNEFGNMSSCTLLFILKEILQHKNGRTFIAGFGPGITMESLIVNKI